MNTNVVCNCCKHNNIIGKGNLLQAKFYIDGKKINVMYFKCLENFLLTFSAVMIKKEILER